MSEVIPELGPNSANASDLLDTQEEIGTILLETLRFANINLTFIIIV
jgi:hypothetical protein